MQLVPQTRNYTPCPAQASAPECNLDSLGALMRRPPDPLTSDAYHNLMDGPCVLSDPDLPWAPTDPHILRRTSRYKFKECQTTQYRRLLSPRPETTLPNIPYGRSNGRDRPNSARGQPNLRRGSLCRGGLQSIGGQHHHRKAFVRSPCRECSVLRHVPFGSDHMFIDLSS